MKKKRIVLVGLTVLTFITAMPVLAAVPNMQVPGYCAGGYGIMWDQDGNFLDREAFEAVLDELIEDGSISAQDKDDFIDRYEWCIAYGGGAAGIRGGGRGRGRGMGCGMGRFR